MRALAGVLFLAGLLAMTSLSTAQPPGGGKGGKGGKGEFPGGGGKGGFGGIGPQPGQIMPQFITDMLKLTDDQKKQVETLQKDVDEKLDKILTDDQKKQLKELKERGPGGFGGGAGGKGGGPGGGGKGGKGGKGGNPPPLD